MLKSATIATICLAFFLTGCATPPKHYQCQRQQRKIPAMAFIPHAVKNLKDPTLIAFYQEDNSVKRPYRIIGREKVSRFNVIGMQRQSAQVNEIMRKVAASMGGDAVINIRQDEQKLEGTVISYERVLL